jgi:hypothetical protein
MQLSETPQPESGRGISPKIVGELRELHAHAEEIANAVGPLSNRRARRELREARHAESDLLRVLGFDSFDEFDAATTDVEAPVLRAVEPVTLAPEPPTQSPRQNPLMQQEVDALRARVGLIEEELAEARFELKELREGGRTANPPTHDDAVNEERSALIEVSTELRLLSELLRRERAEAAEIRLSAHQEADRIIGRAEEVARELIEAAREQAAGSLREAAVTLEGLRHLAKLPEER